jgi:hypothetical protein
MTDQELIEEVAVKVMKWECAGFSQRKPVYSIKKKILFDFDPINNANHWMMVVEKMRDKWILSITDFNSDEWEIVFEHGHLDHRAVIYHKLLGKAVCLAAREAVRGNK